MIDSPFRTDAMPPTLDVIVRTLADASRSRSLFRALDSIQGQAGVSIRPIVVVNGSEFDDATLKELKNRPGVLLHQAQQASAGLALAAGRKLVTAPFFSYLDDDDELIAGSLLQPLEWLARNLTWDVVITNGYFVGDGGVLQEATHIADHIDRPDLGLIKECWLAPGASIFRTATIPASMLNAGWSHLEWTHLAFELCAQRKRLHFMDTATVRYYDTPGSMSKQVQHHEAALDLLREVRRDSRLDPAVRRQADRKYLRVLHNLATTYWKRGEYLRAWRRHLGSMRPPHTLQYLLFSRKLLWPFGRPHKDANATHVSDSGGDQ